LGILPLVVFYQLATTQSTAVSEVLEA
jgi:hypothetical protein